MKPLPLLVAVIAFAGSIGVISWLFQPSVTVRQEDGELVASSNPLLDSRSGPHPVAVLENGVHDFDRMLVGNKASHTFAIRNEGEAPLRLKLKKSTCKCTVPTFSEEAIPVGESVEVKLEWEAQYVSKDFSQHAVLWTNDPEHEELTLQVVGSVAPLVTAIPEFPWMIGNVKEGGDTTFSGIIASGSDEFEILSVEPSEDWLTVEIEPADPADLKSLMSSVNSGYVLKGRVRPEMVIGSFEARLAVKTDLGEGDDATAGGLVIGSRAGPFSIIGQSWLGREMTVVMGDIPHDQGKTVTLALFTDRADEPIEVRIA